MPHRRRALLVALPLLVAACGGGGDEATDATTGDGATTSTTAAEGSFDATTEILGAPTTFEAGGGGADALDAEVDNRNCKQGDEVLMGSCRASTGAGGPFLVTSEGDVAAPGEWNVVVRCGINPAEPVASARGTFLPATTDLGLAPYGEVIAVTLIGSAGNEASLVYHPEGSDCPAVWGLGPVEENSLFLGGTDALNGEERPILFTKVDGTTACAAADGSGGIEVTAAAGDSCSS